MQKLVELFQKIEVIESTRQSKPGSIGYVSTISDMGAYNVVQISVLFTKFGKNGKNRLSISRIKVPLVDIDNLQVSEDDKALLKTLCDREMLPRGHRFSLCDSKIKTVQESSKDLTNLDTWDFMAYISSISLFLSKYALIKNNVNHGAIADVDAVGTFNIGSLICNMFRSKDLHYRLEEFVTYFDNDVNRKAWLELLRREVSVYRQAIITNNTYIFNRYTYARDLINQIAKNNRISIKGLSKRKPVGG